MRDCKKCGMNYNEKEYAICPYCGEAADEDLREAETKTAGSAGEVTRGVSGEEVKEKSDKKLKMPDFAGIGKMFDNKLKLAVVGIAVVIIIGVAISAIFALSDNGVTVPDKYSTIQEAIDAAEEGDEITVDVGIYKESIDFKGKDIILRSTDPDDPSIVDQTIIDGDGGGTVVSFHSGESEEAVLNGFTITRGSGIVVSGGSTPIIKNNVIENNEAEYGAGLAIFDSSPKIIDNLISGNSGFLGGGIFVEESSPLLEGNEITRNHAERGSGVVVILNSAPELLNNTITDNTADDLGAGIVVADNSTPSIKKNLITDNHAERTGGGILVKESEPNIEENTIAGNRAAHGGGMFVVDSMSTVLLIANNEISDNLAAIAGGGLYMEGSSPTLEDNTFTDNKSERGGALVIYNSEPVLLGNLFESNEASEAEGGGALWVSNDSVLELNDPDDNTYDDNIPDDIYEE
ncbi:MAG: right-handed parallel beta-helix repeat-containing protein [Bacillota bacterium]